MDSRPLVSIILGVYNQAPYVEEAIESILSQSYDNFELFIINNGSTDDSGNIISNYSLDKRVTIINYNENVFPTKAANYAISLAQGEYICSIAGDDKYLPSYIEIHLNAIQSLSQEYGVVYSPTYVYNVVSGEKFLEREYFKESGDIFYSLLEAQGCAFIPAYTPFMRKTVFDDIKHDESMFNEGEVLFIRIAQKYKFKFIDTIAYESKDHYDNQGKNYKLNAFDFYQQNQILIKICPEKKKVIYNIIAQMFVRNAWIAIRVMGDKEWARKCIRVAIKHNPMILLTTKALCVLVLYPFNKNTINRILFFKKDRTGRVCTHIDEDYAGRDYNVLK